MKKYRSDATKWLGIITLICFAALAAGILLIVADFPKTEFQGGLEVVLTCGGGVMGLLFLVCFLGERSRVLIIDTDTIVFSRYADKNGKTVIKIDEISSVESKLYKGNGIISKDTYFHTLELKDGTMITFTLYHFGRDREKEILETIKKRIA